MSERVRRLQAWMVRLMVDPQARAAVYAGPVPGLPEADRSLLTRVDARAWTVDTHRRARLLTSLIEEFPVTTAVLGVAGADAFLSSPDFVRVLTGRGSMALAFGAWSARTAGPLAEIELALARSRRGGSPQGAGVCRAPGCVPLTVPSGTLDAWAAAHAQLGPTPVEQVVAGARVAPPRLGRAPSWIMATADGPCGVSSSLYQVLVRCERPRPVEEVVRDARKLGAGDDATVLVEGWLAEGLLVVC